MEFSEVIEVLDRGSSVDVQSNCTFDSLMIRQKTLERLAATGFHRPSPVQAKAIPVGLLGRGKRSKPILLQIQFEFYRYACSSQIGNRKNASVLCTRCREPEPRRFIHPEGYCGSNT